MKIRTRKLTAVWGLVRAVVTLGWLLGVTSLAWSQTLGDFNGDGFADLAIGVPGEDIGDFPSIYEDAGAVNVLHGSAAGLTAAGDQQFSQATPGVQGVAEVDDRFGSGLP
jgi:FG-GAP repeat